MCKQTNLDETQNLEIWEEEQPEKCWIQSSCIRRQGKAWTETGGGSTSEHKNKCQGVDRHIVDPSKYEGHYQSLIVTTQMNWWFDKYWVLKYCGSRWVLIAWEAEPNLSATPCKRDRQETEGRGNTKTQWGKGRGNSPHCFYYGTIICNQLDRSTREQACSQPCLQTVKCCLTA